ncbi:hypothetical protein AB1Y20_005515 [Prymnesium parvum]|uniref:EGF-like domain-containing protein n=1 Tax=Prymnesium parvum TaxID=97485 RepID=A0AB34J4D9_PRYPA
MSGSFHFITAWTLVSFLPTCWAANSSVCTTFAPTDALLLFDPQNCFMEERLLDLSASLSYQVPNGSLTNGGKSISAGPLFVSGSSEITTVMNEWIAYASASGNGTIFATLDWHPEFHCSFCNIHKGGIASGTFCLRGSSTVDDFNKSHRCTDAISDSAYSDNLYFQWPEHCVAGSFGARFDPYLQLPDSTLVIKLGTELMQDEYSALAGGQLSVAGAGSHDSTTSAKDSLSSATLKSEIEERGIKRLFAMGLATDYVVKQTLYHATAILTADYQPSTLTNGTVVLVDAATRGISPTTSADVLSTVAGASNGAVLYATSVEAAMAELCATSCDSRDDCTNSKTEYCRPLSNFDWGECISCPGSTSGLACNSRGVCTDLGTCDCDFWFSGVECEQFSSSLYLLVIIVFAVIVLLVLLLIVAARRGWFASQKNLGVRLVSTGAPPELSLGDGISWHLFLSHIWSTGQDQVAVIKRQLLAFMPESKVFLDVDDLQSIEELEQYVRRSSVILVFLSRGYFLSRNAMREVFAAEDLAKPLVLVHERSRSKGGAPLVEIVRECPQESMQEFVFGEREVIPWVRTSHFQIASLKQIAEAMLLHTPRYRRDKEAGRPLNLFVSGDLALCDWRFGVRPARKFKLQRIRTAGLMGGTKKNGCVLYASPYNPGAADMVQALCACGKIFGLKYSLDTPEALKLGALNSPRGAEPSPADQTTRHSRDRTSGCSRSSYTFRNRMRPFSPGGKFSRAVATSGRPGTPGGPPFGSHHFLPLPPVTNSPDEHIEDAEKVTHLVIYLNEDTWVGEKGDALAEQVRRTQACGISTVLVHEMDDTRGAVEFDRFFHATPEDLVKAGVYKALATQWFSGAHRVVSCALLAQALGAAKIEPKDGFSLRFQKRVGRPSRNTKHVVPSHTDSSATPHEPRAGSSPDNPQNCLK